MKKNLLTCLILLVALVAQGQATYYWVGGASSATINTGANWNTSLDGSGSPRPSSSGDLDILVFNGANIGGATPTTGPATVHLNASITCGQMKFINNAVISFVRNTTGTSTINISGKVAGEDFVIESGSSLSLVSTTGSNVIAMSGAAGAVATGRVSGSFSMLTTLQARIANTTTGLPGSLVFTNGSLFRTNITATSAAYAFGNASQSSEKWVVFEAGSRLYYEGGYSFLGSNNTFSPVDFRPGSFIHYKASNPTSGFGTFFNRKSFSNIIVENGATVTADGTIYRIDSLTVQTGGTFITHSSGETPVLGDIIVNGSLTAPAASTNEIIISGSVPQTISGSGTITVPGCKVADQASLILQKNISVSNEVTIIGSIDFGVSQISGTAGFETVSPSTLPAMTGNLFIGNYFISGVVAAPVGIEGMAVTGTGIAPGTTVVGFSLTRDSVYISKPLLSTATGVSFTIASNGAELITSHPNGFAASTGSVGVSGTKFYDPQVSYIINAATNSPFGISASPNDVFASVKNLTFNAAVTTNTTAHVSGVIQVNSAKVTISPADTLRLLTADALSGIFSPSSYFITATDAAGQQGILRFDIVNGVTIAPVGTTTNYLPVTLTPVNASAFEVSVFEGITQEGTPNGTPLTATQKQTKVDAVWRIVRLSGTGAADIQISWAQTLEGSTLSTYADSEIGIITNLSPGWSLPISTGNNTTNTATATVTSFGAFGIGAQPPAVPFTFNPIPDKIYGNPDFSPGAISLNTTEPIVYTSSNPAVATIVGDQIHITGTGTTNITATQASDGFYPAANVTQTLNVLKADLVIEANDLIKPEGDPNPPLTVTYTGFVYGETEAVLTTPVTVTTTALTSSPPGDYPIVPSGAAAANYTISFVNGTLTVTPKQAQTITFPAFPTKTYGNADFAAGATSSNSTIPITYTSSNPSVATVSGNTIHITGAGTTVITASQAGNSLFFPATSISRTLTVNKANLTVRAMDTTRQFGVANPAFRVVYTGFVLGQSIVDLGTVPQVTTTATVNSSPGYYPIELSGGVSNNYNFNYINGRLTILPESGKENPFLLLYMSSPNTLSVRVYSPTPDIGDLLIYDMSGRLIIRKNIFLAEGFLTYTIPVEIPASGIYVVRIDGKTVRLKGRVGVLR